MSQHTLSKKFAAYPRLNPLGVGRNIAAADLIDQTMLAYNGGRLREAFARALAALDGDQGARDLLRANETLTVSLRHGSFDIDTPADVAAWRAATGASP